MDMTELCYRIECIPDLSLDKYASLGGSGVDGVLKKHLAFLRQWNRLGILSGASMHLFYCYAGGEAAAAKNGSRLSILFLVRGEPDKLLTVPELVRSSALSDYFTFTPCVLDEYLLENGFTSDAFSSCSTLLKKEVFRRPSLDAIQEGGNYYTVPGWEMNESGRLYSMLKLMESLSINTVYRVDIYPVERGTVLRDALRHPMSVLRERLYERTGASGQRDYEAENVLKSYEDLLESIDRSPHFIMNVSVFSTDAQSSAVVLDAAGAEALDRGSYDIGTFFGRFSARSFLDGGADCFDSKKDIVLQRGNPGLIACSTQSSSYKLKYLSTLFTLEEAAPFFRFPALYDGEVIQRRKETAPETVDQSDALYLGVDDFGYDVYFPLKNLTKHAFIAGVPGSGKTNMMYHITSELWRKHNVPFLVLEPAKQEYRALLNQPGMEGVYIFSPNADMTFPLHINPFEFPKGLMLSEHIRRLLSVFEGAFPLENPMPFLLDTAIEAVYRNLGWTPETVYTDETKLKFPTMSMLYKRLSDELESTTYSDEIRGNLESALKVRIGSLLRREMGNVFDVPRSTITPEKWLDIPAIIELEAMGTGPANFLTLMLCALIRETLKVNPRSDRRTARHVLFIEEAHNLIGPESEEVAGSDANPKQAATAFIVKMLAEVRALGEGIVIADQLPTVMAAEVIKNTGLKIGLRITSADDRALLASTMAASELQTEQMATFNIGRALISYEGLMRPFSVQTHLWRGRRNEPHCRELFDMRFCENECARRRSGECVADAAMRAAASVPKTDAELAGHIRHSQPYMLTCVRSFEIEAEKLLREFYTLVDRIDAVTDFFMRMSAEEEKVRELEESIALMSSRLMDETDEDLCAELMLRIDDTVERVNEKKLSDTRRFRGDPMFNTPYSMIVESISFCAKTAILEAHWERMGIDVCARMRNMDVTKTDGLTRQERIAAALADISKDAVLKAQQLFIASREYLASPHKVYEVIAEASRRMGAELKI